MSHLGANQVVRAIATALLALSLSVQASEIFSGISLLSESQVINLHLTTLDLDFEGGLLKGDDNKIRPKLRLGNILLNSPLQNSET